MKYVYLVASLPTLTMDTMPPVTSAEFQDTCSRLLEPADDAEVRNLLAGKEGRCQSPFSRAWFQFEGIMRYRIAAVRAARRKMNPAEFAPDASIPDTTANTAIVEAFARTNPLEREERLDRARWDVIESLGRLEPFGLSRVQAFALHLRMAERWTAMTEGKGSVNLDRHVETLLTGWEAA